MNTAIHTLRPCLWHVAVLSCLAMPLAAAAGAIEGGVGAAAQSAAAATLPQAVAVPRTFTIAAPTALPGCAPCSTVADDVLEQMRGGFDDGLGLQASFGIERVTSINGVEVRTSVQIPDLARITASQMESLRTALSGVTLIQNGPGNIAPLTVNVGDTAIQNTLNNQVIRNTTVLDTATNSLQLLRIINAQATLRDALTLPIGGR